MRNRRTHFKSNTSNVDIIHIIKIVLEILIIVCLLIFIFSSIKLKKRNSLIEISENSKYQTEQSDTNVSLSSTDNSNFNANVLDENLSSYEKNVESKSTTINMALTGDIMCHNTIYKDAYNSELETYDFSYIFDEIKYNIQTADVAIR